LDWIPTFFFYFLLIERKGFLFFHLSIHNAFRVSLIPSERGL
jgi:hypothetical protein